MRTPFFYDTKEDFLELLNLENKEITFPGKVGNKLFSDAMSYPLES
jgi:hypothetical protein